ncbi:MAG: thiosulfate oxidation carrier protein SoxY [Maritimibacter sp.]|nr:thiosulfate oxidation carrier protein SoxY [Maritimibacter sp.]
MTFTRRNALAAGASAIALIAVTRGAFAATGEEAIAAFTGGADVGDGGITLTAPEIAENGNVVPVEVEAPGATEIAIVAPGNPSADIASVKFGPKAGSQRLSTRIRLAKSQDVTALARMGDGSVVMTAQPVKVTVGGCGG